MHFQIRSSHFFQIKSCLEYDNLKVISCNDFMMTYENYDLMLIDDLLEELLSQQEHVTSPVKEKLYGRGEVSSSRIQW